MVAAVLAVAGCGSAASHSSSTKTTAATTPTTTTTKKKADPQKKKHKRVHHKTATTASKLMEAEAVIAHVRWCLAGPDDEFGRGSDHQLRPCPDHQLGPGYPASVDHLVASDDDQGHDDHQR